MARNKPAGQRSWYGTDRWTPVPERQGDAEADQGGAAEQEGVPGEIRGDHEIALRLGHREHQDGDEPPAPGASTASRVPSSQPARR